ncbi:MAG: endonuclease/exonuclease/phosphatase family protein [Polyangiaceae bacterium]|nr:endonuclease/exonuclease/phosphatase family protein [Polyangiaceae bacterium]
MKKFERYLALFGLGYILLSRFVSPDWWLDLAASFELQLAALLVAGAVLALLRLRFLMMFCHLLLVLFILYPVLISGRLVEQKALALRNIALPLHAASQPNADSLRIALQNVRRQNSLRVRLLQSLRQTEPDIIGLLEVDEDWMGAIRSTFPSWKVVAVPREDNFGLALLSRVPFLDHKIHRTNSEGLPSIEVAISTFDGPVRVELVHAMPPLGRVAWQLRNQQIEEALLRARKAEQLSILLGDFNLTPTSPSWSKLIAPSTLQRVGAPWGTWPAALSGFGLCLDHVLVSEGIAPTSTLILPALGSDHRGQFVSVKLPSEALHREPKAQLFK